MAANTPTFEISLLDKDNKVLIPKATVTARDDIAAGLKVISDNMDRIKIPVEEIKVVAKFSNKAGEDLEVSYSGHAVKKLIEEKEEREKE